MPLRAGVVRISLGIPDKRYKIVKPDLFGRPFEFSRLILRTVGDCNVLTMGEGTEQQPLAVISGAPVDFVNKIKRGELKIDIKEDIYKPLFDRYKL